MFVERLEKEKDTDKNVDANHDRTRRPAVWRDTSHAQGASQTRSSHDSKSFNVEDETNHQRSMLNELDNDFRVSGLLHAVVKQAENFRVRELVKKTESHFHRQALQADLQQNNADNPFSEKSKKMAMQIYLSYARVFLKRNATNAFLTGIKESFTALAGIS